MQTRRPVTSRIAASALACAGALCALSAAQAAAPAFFAVVPVSGVGTVGQLRPVKMALAGATPPAATVGVPYEFNLGELLSLDGPEGTTPDKVAWRVVSGALPAGLALTGDRISGVPTILTPPSPVVIQAEYQGGARTVGTLASYPFQVLHPVSIGLDAGALPPAYIGQPYQVDLTQFLALDGPTGTTAAGVTWQLSADALPPGLNLSGSGISGTPTTYSATPSSFSVSASFGEKSTTQAYSISIASIPLAQFSGYRAWEDGTFAQSCEGYIRPTAAEHVYAGVTGDGVYKVQPAGTPVNVYCDQSHSGGGWTLIMTNNLPNFTNRSGIGTSKICTSISGCNTGGTSTFYRDTPVEVTLHDFMFTSTNNGDPYKDITLLERPGNFVRDAIPAPGVSLFRLMTDAYLGWAPAGLDNGSEYSGDLNQTLRIFHGTNGISWSDGNWYGVAGHQGMNVRNASGAVIWGHHNYAGPAVLSGGIYTIQSWTYYPYYGWTGFESQQFVPQSSAENLSRWTIFVR